MRDEKEKKTYPYIEDLLKRVFHARTIDQVGLSKKVVLQEDDPRRISSTISTVLPPLKEELILEQKSRLAKQCLCLPHLSSEGDILIYSCLSVCLSVCHKPWGSIFDWIIFKHFGDVEAKLKYWVKN